jgi:hypothetical protein
MPSNLQAHLAILLVSGALGYLIFVPDAKLSTTNGITIRIPTGMLDTSSGAGVLAFVAIPGLAVLFALVLADRKRLCCANAGANAEPEHGAAAHTTQQSGQPGADLLFRDADALNDLLYAVHGAGDGEDAKSSGNADLDRGGAAAPPDPSPSPAVFEQDSAYLVRCTTAAAEVERVLHDEQRPAKKKKLEQHLKEKHGLCYRPSSEHGDGVDEEVGEESDDCAELDAAAKVLRSLVMRFPLASDALLAPNRFEWARGSAPLRVDGYEKLDAALKTWTDKTTSAADSALFSSLGIWVSPFTMPFLALAGLGLSVQAVSAATSTTGASPELFPFSFTSGVSAAIGCSSAAVALRLGYRSLAAKCFMWGELGFVFSSMLDVVFAVCKCWGPYSETHAPTGNPTVDSVLGFPWYFSYYRAFEGLSNVPLAVTATHPHHSFGLVFVAFPALGTLSYLSFALDYARFWTRVRGVAWFAAVFGSGTFMWRRRAHALEKANKLDKEDTMRYVTLWNDTLLRQPCFRDELRELREAWGAVQAGAAHEAATAKSMCQCPPQHTSSRRSGRARNSSCECGVPRQQSDRSGVGALFREADALNDLLHAKLHELCTAHSGEFHRSDVKTEARALQKVFRTYGGRWWRLSDLCRSSLVFETVPQMAACLRAIGNDDELKVVPSNEIKMRLREDFDAPKLTGGYRDVQLTVLFDNAKTRERGVHRHLAEVQLHLGSILELKSDSGHANYVLRRNLRGN